jgi:hypothetical protein
LSISIETIQKNLESDRRFRERRHQQWTDNYLLDRDIVITNRLTQRQSVNVPLMKETRKTILASSEPQDIYFENLDNDGQKELLMNEWFKHVAERERLEILNDRQETGVPLRPVVLEAEHHGRPPPVRDHRPAGRAR